MYCWVWSVWFTGSLLRFDDLSREAGAQGGLIQVDDDKNGQQHLQIHVYGPFAGAVENERVQQGGALHQHRQVPGWRAKLEQAQAGPGAEEAQRDVEAGPPQLAPFVVGDRWLWRSQNG